MVPGAVGTWENVQRGVSAFLSGVANLRTTWTRQEKQKNSQYTGKQGEWRTKTLPEAQRTQGIDSIS